LFAGSARNNRKQAFCQSEEEKTARRTERKSTVKNETKAICMVEANSNSAGNIFRTVVAGLEGTKTRLPEEKRLAGTKSLFTERIVAHIDRRQGLDALQRLADRPEDLPRRIEWRLRVLSSENLESFVFRASCNGI
jgi:hypothetical protein